jgi:glycine/D-amino acid oxidase-like deaminating enzyme
MFQPEYHGVMGVRDASRDWLGFRPTLPDYLPVIGRSSDSPAGKMHTALAGNMCI